MDKSEMLWNQLRADGNYNRSYAEFLRQFSTPEKIENLHAVLASDGHYTKSVDDFKKQFFPTEMFTKQRIDDETFKRIPITDNRKVDTITGLPMTDTNRMHADVDSRYVKRVVEKATKYGVDPYTALAMNLQETGFQDKYSDNPYFIVQGFKSREEVEDFEKDPINFSMKMLRDKHDYAKKLGKTKEEDVIQAWNGYGKIGPQRGINRVYGIDVSNEPIDMNKNPVYGKRIVDLRDNVLKQNPEITELVNKYSSVSSDE
jgi:hypothetical protein